MAISLASISKTKRASKPPKIIIYGPKGVGKTTLALNAYRPIFLPFEDGLDGIDDADAFPVLKTWEETNQALDSLLFDEHEFSTAVIDSADWLEPVIWNETARALNVASIEAVGYGKGYLEACTYWRQFLQKLDQLREQRGMTVIILAHEEVKRFEPPDMDAFDRYQIKVHKLAAALLQEWAGIIGFANFETALKKKDAGFNKEIVKGVSTGRRFLYVTNNPAYEAKNRYGMPERIDLSWPALVAAIQGQ